ncbi:halovibrin HvnC [Pseudomonas sp. RL_35y_Pfl2_P42]|uniref:halovibrin HvnC n=1 Tax=Pseudomonas sp. RL_35y_Pfl2_P42 TaxID=3088710 RepID=UPI0030D7CC00
MRYLIALMFITLLAGCSQTSPRPPTMINASSTQVMDGFAIAAYLQTLYGRKFPNCNKVNSQPAFLCSGVTIRVTLKSTSYKVWEPSPFSVRQGGVAFSYLRADADFGRFAYERANGYILYPVLEAPVDKYKMHYLCAYPYDAWSHTREADKPCGPHPSYPAQSRLCQDTGVTTAEQWLAVWRIPEGNPNQRQCGFDVNDNRNALAGPAFYQSIRARSLVNGSGVNEHNELTIKTWCDPLSTDPEKSCAQSFPANKFPIMAFFYTQDGQALADAQYNQRDFYNSTNPKIIVPIIRLVLSTSIPGTAKFEYIPADQTVTP